MDLENELDVAEDIVGYNPKNYQVWYHRRALSEYRGNAGKELEYVDRVVADDPKNYHAWSHRQWLLKEFCLLDTEEGRRSELAVVDALLNKDLRNNSAWNHRWFILHASLGQTEGLSDETVRSELTYALGFARRAPSNESPWNFVRGFFRVAARSYANFPEVEKTARSLQMTDLGAKSPHVHSLLTEIYEQEGTEEALNEAINVLQRLRNELDVVRVKYWETRLRSVTRRLVDLVSPSTANEGL